MSCKEAYEKCEIDAIDYTDRFRSYLFYPRLTDRILSMHKQYEN